MQIPYWRVNPDQTSLLLSLCLSKQRHSYKPVIGAFILSYHPQHSDPAQHLFLVISSKAVILLLRGNIHFETELLSLFVGASHFALF